MHAVFLFKTSDIIYPKEIWQCRKNPVKYYTSSDKQQTMSKFDSQSELNSSFCSYLHTKNTHSCLLWCVWPWGSESSQLSAASVLRVAEIGAHCSITSCAFKYRLSFYYLQIASDPLQGHSRPQRVLWMPPMGLLLLNCFNSRIHFKMFVWFPFIYFFHHLFYFPHQKTHISIQD